MPQQIELRNIALQAAQPLVHGVSLTLQRGRVLALVGSSGSGKSLTCAAALGILPAGVRQTAGEILADGKPVSPCALRGIKIATIMQNPRSAFNPLHTMHTHARETCLALGKPADDATLTAALEAVGLENAARVLKLYPFEMSGGMLQRMMIAMAVLCESPFIIADEPTTDLDVVAQARHNAHIMGHQQHSRRLFLHNAFQQIEDARLCYHVEIGGRFIGDDKRRFTQHR
ncbi:ATP-binding cassette domain-containing protein, partial [Escherichia coli]|uniref:ATP-binding cassette domain-containing protein n=1 Tax=Escherichia coli TaxID=562 RepID=UPI000B18151D